MNKPYTFLILVLTLTVVHAEAKPVSWPYDSAYQPITKREIAETISNPKTTVAEHETLRGRSGTSHLMEYAVALYDAERKKRPDDPVLQGAFCYEVLVSQSGEYTPSDHALFNKQRETLSNFVPIYADEIIRKQGSEIAFCWRAAAYANIIGIGTGWGDGIKKAEKALSLDPNDSYTLRLLAFAHTSSSNGDADKAITYANRVVKLAPKSSRGYSYLYNAYSHKKDYKKAFYYLKLAQNRMPLQNRNQEAYTTFRILAQRQAEEK